MYDAIVKPYRVLVGLPFAGIWRFPGEIVPMHSKEMAPQYLESKQVELAEVPESPAPIPAVPAAPEEVA